MKIKFNFLLLLWFLILSTPISAQNVMHLKDYDGNNVDFFLVSKDGKTVLRSNFGAITIDRLKKHMNKNFTLHFDNRLAYLLYHTDLYNDNGIKTKDPHIRNDKIIFDKITKDEDGIFYLRRKEIRLNGAEDEEGE